MRSGESNQADQGTEDYPLSEVPPEGRRGAASLYFVLLGFTFFTATMFGGAQVGVAFPFFPDLIGLIVVGNLLLGLYVAALAQISARSGLGTVLLARFAFGTRGSALVDLLLGFTQVGWYAWGTATIAVALCTHLGWPDATKYPLMIFFGFAFCWTAYIGYRGLEILSWIAVPLMSFLIFWSISVATVDAGGWSGLLALEPDGQMSYSDAITIIFGTFASGGTQVTNWTRFARRESTAIAASLSAFFIGNGLMIFMGAYGALVYQEADVVQVLIVQGLFSLGIVMLFLNIWTTQDNTIYNFSVAGCSLLRSDRRRAVTLAGAAVGTALALGGIHEYLTGFLILLGVFIPPVGGVLMAEFWFVHRGRLPLLAQTTLPAISARGIAAYAIGSAAALLCRHFEVAIPPVVGIVAAAGACVILRYLPARAPAVAR